MAGPLIVVGDKTSHGGSVTQGAPSSDSGGVPIARVGDQTSCPKHGNNPIASGDASLIIDGKAAARDGDKTACGATLIASQHATIDLI